MFIRKTATRSKSASETYFTYRLVTSERTGKQVRQITLLNLGRRFDLPQSDWPRLCARIEALLDGQAVIPGESGIIETLAQRYAARLIATQSGAAQERTTAGNPVNQPCHAPPAAPDSSFAEVDVASLQLTRPRSVGVEAVG